MPFNTYRSGTMQASLAADPHRQTLFNAFASWMDGIINDEEIARHVNKEKDPSIRVALFAIRDQLRNNLDSTYATQCVNRIADRRAQGVVRQLYAYGLDLLSPAMDAVRRLGGTALYVPDDYGLVLGPELAVGTWVSTAGSTVSGTDSSVTASGGSPTRAALTLLPVIAGRQYVAYAQVDAETSIDAGVVLFVRDGASPGTGTVLTSKTFSTSSYTGLLFTPTSGFANLLWAVGDSSSFSISRISVREILSATTFIDSTGTQPVTAVNDLVGLLTDRSYGAGNLVSVTLPALSGWTYSVWTYNAGGYIDASAGLGYALAPGVTLTPGKSYRVNCTSSGAGTVNAVLGGSYQSFSLVVGGNSAVFVCGAGTEFMLQSGANAFQLRDIYVREVLGNHASQPTTASKPLVTQLANGTKALDFDGSNDHLITTSTTGTTGWVCAAFVADVLGFQAVLGSGAYNAAEPGVAIKLRDNGQLWFSTANGTLIDASYIVDGYAAGVPLVVTATWSPASTSVWINGVLKETRASPPVAAASAFRLGAHGPGLQESFNGKLIDWAAGQTALSTSDRKTIERNMAQRAGVVYVG